MILPFLPDEERTLFEDHDYAGVIAIWRPMDLLDKAKWADKCLQGKISFNSQEARVIMLQKQLLRIEGLEIKNSQGEVLPFDVKEHLRYIPFTILRPIWEAIEVRSALSELDAKNSERPSDSGDPSGTATSSAEPALQPNEMSSVAS